MSIISDPINFIIDNSNDIGLTQIQINKYLTPIYDTATNPKFSWENNKNTGMYHPQLNTIAFSTDGNERLRLDASGNINFSGIITGNGSGLNQLNATNIRSGILTVSQGGTGKNTLTNNQILIGNGTDPLIQTSNLTWDNPNNRLGIGITVPIAKLDISYNTTETVLKVNQSGTGNLVDLQVTNNSILKIDGNKNINMNNNLIYTNANTNRVGIGTTEPSVIFDVSGNARIQGNLEVNGITNIISTNVANSKQLNITNEGTGPALTINQKGTADIIEIKDDNVTCLKIFDGGNLGIGIASKTVTVDISGNFNVSQTINTSSINVTTILNTNMIDVSNNSVNTALKVNQFGTGNLVDLQDNSVSKFKIDTCGNIFAGALYIDSSNNNVGIGTTRPDISGNIKLHVSGNARIEGNLTVNGTLTQVNTVQGTTEQLRITNDGTGPAVIINQTGTETILDIQDDGATCFKIRDGGHIDIGTSSKLVNVDISGNIKTSGTITSIGTITSTSTISSTGNISSSAYVIATGTGAHSSYGNTRIGNTLNWGGTIHPTLGSSGTTSVIMLDNPHITYKTDNTFSPGRTFRAGFRCPTSSSYANYWDCGATGYGFEILNSSLNNDSTSCITITSTGNIGIGNTAPIGPLCIGNSALANNDGFLVLGKCTTVGSTRQFRLGLNASFDFVIGDYGGNNTADTWLETFKLSYQAPANSLVINSLGYTTLRNVLYVGNATESSTIFLGGGITDDGDYNNSVIETRKYAGIESTELLLFKGNDIANVSNVGPDRIRLRAAAIAFDTYPAASSVRTSENIRMYIDQSGNVGINTVVPRAKLDIYDNSMVVRSTDQTGQAVIYLGTPFDTTSAFKCAIIAEGIGSTSRSKLHFCIDDTSDNSVTYNASITNSRMTILRSGNIGIGNTNPLNILQIGNAGRLRISNDNTDYTLIGTIDTDTNLNSKIIISGNGRVANEGNIQYYSTNTGSHIWYTENTNSERMRIKSNGNVGLGQSDPQYKLDMLGDINLSGDIKVNGVSFINSVLVTPSYFSLFDRIAGPSTLTSNYTFTSSNSFSVFRSGILNISYSGDVKSVSNGLINATINIINTITLVTIYTKVTSLLADQPAKNYLLPSILDNIGLTNGTYHATITFNTNTQIDYTNFQTLKVLFFPDNNVSNGLYSYNTKISYIFHKLNGVYDLSPDGTQVYSTRMNNILGSVVISTGTAKINNFTIPKGYQIWTVGATGTYTIIAAGASGASYGSYAGGRGATISTTYNLTAGEKIILAVGQKPKNLSSGGGGSFVTKYIGTGLFATPSQHNIILVAGGGGGAGSGIVPGSSNVNVLDYLPGRDASFTTSGTRYNFKDSTKSSSNVAKDGGGGGGNGLAGGNSSVPDGIDAIQTGSGSGGGGFTGSGGDVDTTCTGGRSFLNGGLSGQNTWGSNNTGAGFGGGGAGWYSGGGGGGYSGGQGANYDEQTGGGGGGSYDINNVTNNASPYTLWLATSSYPPSSYITSGYNSGDGFILIEYDNGQLLGSKSDTETNPFYSWSEDIDTGIYHPATNSIALTTNGSEKLRVDSSGNIGIGKTNPMYKLDIFGNNGEDNVKMNGNLILSTDGSSNYIKCGGIMSNQNGILTNFSSVSNNAGLCFINSGSLALISNSAERMRIINNGNIGINTTTPIYNLQIGDNTNTNQIISTTNIHLTNNNFDSGNFGVRIAGIDNGTNGHNFKVLTRNTSIGTFTESFTVSSSGYVGIGITQPNASLHVLSTNNTNGFLLNHTNASGNIINIQKNGTTNLKIDNSGNLFASSGLYVDSYTNYVGIHMTNPSYNLHVNGSVKIEGELYFNGTSTTINTTIQNTDQLNITNNGTGTTIIANQTGSKSILELRNNNNTKFEVFSSGNVEIGKSSSNVNVDIFGNLTVSGVITASGSQLYNINASNINSGVLTVAYGGTGVTSSTGSGSVVFNTNPIITNGTFSGIGSGLSNLNANNINNGKLNVLYGGTGVNTSTGSGSVVLNTNPIITDGTFSGVGSGLTSLNATNISTGILSIANGGTGCTILNTLFFDTTGGVLSVKNKAFNPWEIIGNNLNYTMGSIAIGKITPSSTLDVSGNITASGDIIGNINATNIIYGTLSSTNGGTGCSSINNTFFDTTGGILSLKAGAASQWISNGNKLYYNTGNVGIGKTNPLFEMDVSGNINFTGSLYKNGSQYISSQWTTGTNNTDLYFNSGNVAIGKITPNAMLDISGNVFVKGSISATGDIVANYSDDRLKNRISYINNSLEIINKLTAFKYTPNKEAIDLGIINEDVSIGLSAQDVQIVLPEIVSISPLDIIEKDGKLISKTGKNYLSIKYERLVPIFVEAIKELQKKIKSQDERIKELETKITKILNYINA